MIEWGALGGQLQFGWNETVFLWVSHIYTAHVGSEFSHFQGDQQATSLNKSFH